MFQRAFSVSTREPAALFFAPGGHSPTGVFVAWCNVGTFVRLCFGVSCGIARARSFVRDRGHVVAVAMSCPSRPWPWPSCPGRRGRGRHVSHVVAVASVASRTWPRHGRGRVVFVSPCGGCDTPMDASVCNGFGVVCVDSICLTFVRRV